MTKENINLSSVNSFSIGYIKGIDILRFIAALGVVIHHISYGLAQNQKITTPFLSHHLNSGAFFLNLFFVISGFLISMILFKELDSGKFTIKNFYIRRMLRIWPLYFFVIIAYDILLPLIMHKGEIADILYNVFFASLFITNFQAIFYDILDSTYLILWSVGIEEQIYLIFPFIILLFKKSRLLMTFSLIIIGLFSWIYTPELITSANNYNSAYFFTLSYLYYFGVGCLLTFLIPKNNKTLTVDKVLLNPVVQLFIMILGFAYVFNILNSPKLPKYFFLFFNAAFPAYLIYCAVRGKLIFNLFSDKITKFLGNVSYPMYLIHIQVISLGMIITRTMNPNTSNFVMYDLFLTIFTIIVTISLSSVLYRFIEKPFLKLKKDYTIISNK